jgi:hypothetical protein
MPPVGNFAVPASNSKEKKRVRNVTAPSGSQANAIAESSGRGGIGGPNNKVRFGSQLLLFTEIYQIHLKLHIHSLPSESPTPICKFRRSIANIATETQTPPQTNGI